NDNPRLQFGELVRRQCIVEVAYRERGNACGAWRTARTVCPLLGILVLVAGLGHIISSSPPRIASPVPAPLTGTRGSCADPLSTSMEARQPEERRSYCTAPPAPFPETRVDRAPRTAQSVRDCSRRESARPYIAAGTRARGGCPGAAAPTCRGRTP